MGRDEDKDIVEEEGVEYVEADGKIDVDKPREEKSRKVEWVEMDGEKLNVDKSRYEQRAEIPQQKQEPNFFEKILTKKETPKEKEREPIIIKVQQENPTSREDRVKARIDWVKNAMGKLEGSGEKPKPQARPPVQYTKERPQPPSQFGDLSFGGGMMIESFKSGGGGSGLGSMILSGNSLPQGRARRGARISNNPMNPMVRAMLGGGSPRRGGGGSPRRIVAINPMVIALSPKGTARRGGRARVSRSPTNPMVRAMMGGSKKGRRWF